MNFPGSFSTKRSELRLLWQSRIETFQSSGEKSVASWCAKQEIPVQSTYLWLRKSRTKTETNSAQWMPVVLNDSFSPETTSITLKLNGISIECPPDFDQEALTKILQVVQRHVQ